MFRAVKTTIFLLFFLVSGAQANMPDPHSYANMNDVRIQHMKLDLTADFEAKTLEGTIELAVERINARANELILDGKDLTIKQVELLNGGLWIETSASITTPDPVLGQKIAIHLPKSSNTVRIHYKTSPSATALQWLDPSQTAGKKQPFLYTQSQPIYARSWLPIQDSPRVRMTYEATIRVPKTLRAVMSAENSFVRNKEGIYRFVMPQAIPSYLVALAIGDLDFKAMSKRTGIFAEPAIIDAAAAEFEDTEQMMVVAEQLFGPYRWGRYDLLILPPSYPMGGMENPRLSFITPTVIAGDKSLVNLIAHELAHSWSGNLVTNASWEHLWLNEGFTSYVESRIMEALYGKQRALMENYLGYQSLLNDLSRMPKPDQHLVHQLAGRDPDDSFSEVPYVKGQMFLTYLEHRVGREAFDQFLRQYFDQFAFKSLDSDQFIDYINANLLKEGNTLKVADINAWLHQPGLPKDAVIPHSDRFVAVDDVLAKWLADKVKTDALPVKSWSVHEWLHFLNALPDDVAKAKFIALDQQFSLTQSTNNEIAHVWLLKAIHLNYQPAFKRLDHYLKTIGRRKLIQPLYEALMKEHSQLAKQIYTEARSGYHRISTRTIDQIVHDE